MGNSARRDIAKVNALTRDEKALALRLTGKSFNEIGKLLKYGSRQGAYRAVKKRIDALNRECNEAAGHVKTMELQRLDAMLVGLWKKAAKGDPAAVDRVLRIQERRSSYQGLDAPKLLKVELERELSGHIEKLKAGLAPDVFEQVLAVLAGEHGAATTGSTEGGPPEEDDRRADEPG